MVTLTYHVLRSVLVQENALKVPGRRQVEKRAAALDDLTRAVVSVEGVLDEEVRMHLSLRSQDG